MRVFVGGATGAVGRAFVQEGLAAGLELVPHVRPKSAHKHQGSPEPAVFELTDPVALDRAMAGCDAVVCAIGTMRKRFAQGDTYQSSDIDGARLLAEAGARVGVGRYLLVGAAGAGWVPGAYYDAKRAAEEIARTSGLSWTIFRPAALRGFGREVPPGSGLLGAFGVLPGLRGLADDVRVIDVVVVARAMVRCLVDERYPDTVVTGRHMWELVGAAPQG